MIGCLTTFLTWTFLLLYLIPDSYDARQIFYGLWICGFYVSFSGIYAIMAPAVQSTFGHLNYSRDYGLLFTQSVCIFLFLLFTIEINSDKEKNGLTSLKGSRKIIFRNIFVDKESIQINPQKIEFLKLLIDFFEATYT